MANAAHEPTLRPALRGAVDLAAVEAPRPLCHCHDEEMWWNADKKGARGGYWRCKRGRFTDAHLDYKAAWARAKYDSDHLYRIQKRLDDDRRSRARSIYRRKAAMTPTEGG